MELNSDFVIVASLCLILAALGLAGLFGRFDRKSQS